MKEKAELVDNRIARESLEKKLKQINKDIHDLEEKLKA